MGKYKKFDSELYDKHNGPAVSRVLRELLDSGLFAKQNDDLYGPDIVVFRGYKPSFYVEVEQRERWEGCHFPWTEVHLPERKGKYLEVGLPLEIWVLSKCLKFCLVYADTCIIPERLREFSNSSISSGELFYHIPIEECSLRELE